MTLLAGIFSLVFTRLLGRWRGALVAILGISLYTVLVGAQPAVVRAAVMGGLSVLAAQLGRRQSGLTSLALTCAVMAGIQPNLLWDVGFQLSVTATFGLVMYGEAWTERFYAFSRGILPEWAAGRIKGPVGEYFLLTLAAQLMTLPVIVYHFHRQSLVSLLANPLILPIQPALMMVGGLSLLAGWLWLPLGSFLAMGGWVFAALTIRMVEMLAAVPVAELLLPPVGLVWVVGFYALLLLMTLPKSRVGNLVRLVRPGVVFFVLGVLVVQVWRTAWAAPDGLLYLKMLDTNTQYSSGEGILIHTPGGRLILVNGGPSMTRLSDSLGRRLVGSGLDVLVVAGVEEGQLQSLPDVLPRYMPDLAFWSGEAQANRVSRSVYSLLQEPPTSFQRLQVGTLLDLGDGAVLRVLALSRRGSVLLLEWQRFRFLLPLGMDFDNLEALMTMPELEGVSGLVLAGSGYAPLNPPDWLEYLDPEVIILSVSAQDASGLPDTRLIESIRTPNLLRTDRDGWIEITTDGQQMWVEVERK